jgi:hypothetical protein
MTDETPTDSQPETAGETTDRSAKPLSALSNKALWAGIGIGSAAIVAAVMYTRRPKKKK